MRPRPAPLSRPEPAAPYRHPVPATDAALDWLLRLREEDSPALRAAFQDWLAADPAHPAAWRDVQAVWRAAVLSAPVLTAAANRNRRPRRLALAAAAAMLALGLWQAPEAWLRWQADAITRPGESRQMVLADGSVLRLNTDTLVALDVQGGRRHVTLLRGEAFFQVAHDPAHPFTVSAPHGDVTVTGTRFNVRLDAQGDHVLLEQGSVRLSQPKGGRSLPLHPGQAAIMEKGRIAPQPADAQAELAWLDGRIDIADLPLADAVAHLGRYLDRRVILLPGAPARARVSGSFGSRDPATAIRTLAETAGAGMREIPGAIILY